MSDATEQSLEQAFERVEAGFPEEAVAILKPILDSDPDDIDAWWIYAHAVSDPLAAREALNNVMRLDPDYPGAAEVMMTLDDKFPAPRIRRLDAAPPPESMPEAPMSIPEPDAFAAPAARSERGYAAAPMRAAPPPRQRSSLPLIPIIAVIIIVVIGLIILSGGGGGQSTATATSVVQIAASDTPGIISGVDVTDEATQGASSDVTDEPSAEPTADLTAAIDATDELTSAATNEATSEITSMPDATVEVTDSAFGTPETTPESTADAGSAGVTGDFSALDGILSRYTLPENGVAVIETRLGNTLQISVCSARGPEMRARVQEVLTLVARESPSLPSNVEAITARMTNCDDGSTLQILGVDRASADAFANRTMNAAAFEATWQPL